jgi:beta-glucosidase
MKKIIFLGLLCGVMACESDKKVRITQDAQVQDTDVQDADALAQDSSIDTSVQDADAMVQDASETEVFYDPADLLREGAVDFPAEGAISGDEGEASFTFGAATAAAQIEEGNVRADWYVWTQARDEGGLAKGEFVGDAVQGYSMAVADVALLREMNLDAYRFSVNWARMEPTRDNYDDEAFAHYEALLTELNNSGIKPMVTLHHFSNPIWVDDPRRNGDCVDGPQDDHLCGWNHPEGGTEIIEEIAEFGKDIATRYGHLVDEWCTLNEPVNYLLASYGLTTFPPGRNLLLSDFDAFMSAVRNYIRAHVALYDAIMQADQEDADGDGIPAHVGLTLNVNDFVPTYQRELSENPADVNARNNVNYVYHYLLLDALKNGSFDSDLDQISDENYPDWQGKIDFLGFQYYARLGVTGRPSLIEAVQATPCFIGVTEAFGPCIPPKHESKWVPTMHYEYYEPAIYNLLVEFANRYPSLPITVTESGLATEVGERRAEHIVRSLEQIWRAREAGVDVRGYYHWSLIDNFEWAEGYEPRFGLYRVNREANFARTPTLGATVLGEIARNRTLSPEQRSEYGGLGPMTEENEQ